MTPGGFGHFCPAPARLGARRHPMRESRGARSPDRTSCAEGAIPPRNLSGTRTALGWHSGGHRADRGGGPATRPQGACVPDPTPTSASSAVDGLGEFVARHIGPDDAAVAHMLEAIGHESLESLMTAAVPGGIRSAAALDLPGPARRGGDGPRAAHPRLAEPSGRGDDRPRLPRHHHAGGDPAQRARGPLLVHRLHALPAGDLPGPPRGAAQLPDRRGRPDRACPPPTPRCSTRAPPPPRR